MSFQEDRNLSSRSVDMYRRTLKAVMFPLSKAGSARIGIKLMANYVHTWSDFREAHPQFGDDQFDEVILRLQVMY